MVVASMLGAAMVGCYYLGCFHTNGCPKSFNMQFDIPHNCYQCDCVVLYFQAFDSPRESWQV